MKEVTFTVYVYVYLLRFGFEVLFIMHDVCQASPPAFLAVMGTRFFSLI